MSNTNTPDEGPQHEATTTGPILSEKWYERLKWFTLVFLPAFGAAYFSASLLIPVLPYAAEVVGLTAILATLFGSTVAVSNRNFKKSGADGSIKATIDGDTVYLSKLNLSEITPEDLAGRNQIVVQVNPNK